MKDIYQLLREKEADVERVRREIEAMRLTISLLEDEPSTDIERKQPVSEAEPIAEADQTGTEGPSFSTLDKSGSGFWKRRR